MVKFVDVDPDEIPNMREARRGRVSYPITKTFLESGKAIAMLDRTGIHQSLQSLQSCLFSYIRNHELPIKMFTRRGQIYFMRLDLDEQGNPIENWKKEATTDQGKGELQNMPAVPINDDEVAERFDQERGASTK